MTFFSVVYSMNYAYTDDNSAISIVSLGLGIKNNYISSPSKSALNLSTTDKLNYILYYYDSLIFTPPNDSSRTDGYLFDKHISFSSICLLIISPTDN